MSLNATVLSEGKLMTMSSPPRPGALLDEIEHETAAKPAQKSERGIDSRLIASIGLAVVSVGVLGYVILSAYRGYADDPKRMASYTVVVDSETGVANEKFPLPADGKGYPALNPQTGRRTIFPAEACYWTKDGKAKLQPTYVVLNQWLGKPGQTKCPDCGRTVTKGNRMPPDDLMQAAWDASQKK